MASFFCHAVAVTKRGRLERIVRGPDWTKAEPLTRNADAAADPTKAAKRSNEGECARARAVRVAGGGYGETKPRKH